MPKRRTVIKVACDEVQGDDSWVELRVFTYKEMRDRWALADRANPPGKEKPESKGADLIADKDKVTRVDLIKTQEDEEETLDLTGEEMETLAQENFDHVLSWNWVDDNGESLPQPQERPDVLELLNAAETRFLGRALSRSRSDLKN